MDVINDGSEDETDVSDLDMKLLEIISDITYPEGVHENEVDNMRYKVVAENDDGVDTYIVEKHTPGKNSGSSRGTRSGNQRKLIQNDRNTPLRTFRIVKTAAHPSGELRGSSSDVNEVHDKDGLLGAAANENEGYSYARPESSKTVKVEGGLVLRILNGNGRGGLRGSSSRDNDIEVVRVKEGGRSRGRGQGRPEEVRVMRVRGPRGRNRNRNRNGRLRRPPPPQNHHSSEEGGRSQSGRTIRIIREEGSSSLLNGSGNNINPDIQAFQIISGMNNNGRQTEDGSRRYRIRILQTSEE